MILEAVVHPTSISINDPHYDPSIHIAVEVLGSSTFKQKMIGLPVTAYHHDTMKAVHMLARRKKELTGNNMREVLIELNETQPGPLQLARQTLKRRQIPATTENVWQILPEVIAHARGPGVLGSVIDFWRDRNRWMVKVDIDPRRISSFQMKLIKKGGALGEVSLTHAVIDGRIEPLELSFTIQGLRTGSAINRIISASSKQPRHKSNFQNIMAEFQPTEDQKDQLPSVQEDDTDIDPVRGFYNGLTPSQQEAFLPMVQGIKSMSTASNKAQERRLAELEKAMNVVQEATAAALNELGPSCFGNIRQRSAGEWAKNPESLATANEFILAAAANSFHKRKRENDELDAALKDLTSAPVDSRRVVTASVAKAVKTAETPAEDEFFKELRNMRQALRNLP